MPKVAAIDEDGRLVSVPLEEYNKGGYKPASAEDLEAAGTRVFAKRDGQVMRTNLYDYNAGGFEPASVTEVEAYKELEEENRDRGLMTGLESFLSTYTWGLGPLVERGIGAAAGALGFSDQARDLSPEAQRMRQDLNPGSGVVGDIAAFLSPTGLAKGVAGRVPVLGKGLQAGLGSSPVALVMEMTPKALRALGPKATAAQRLATAAKAQTVEGAIFGTGEVIERMALERPTDVSDAATIVGGSAVMSGVLGGTLELAAPGAASLFRKAKKGFVEKVYEPRIEGYLNRTARMAQEDKVARLGEDAVPADFFETRRAQVEAVRQQYDEFGRALNSKDAADAVQVLQKQVKDSTKNVADTLEAGAADLERAADAGRAAAAQASDDAFVGAKKALDLAEQSGDAAAVKVAKEALDAAEQDVKRAADGVATANEEATGTLWDWIKNGYASRYRGMSKGTLGQSADRVKAAFSKAKPHIDEVLEGAAPSKEVDDLVERLGKLDLGGFKNDDWLGIFRAVQEVYYDLRRLSPQLRGLEADKAADAAREILSEFVGEASKDVQSKVGGVAFERAHHYWAWYDKMVEELGEGAFKANYKEHLEEYLRNHPHLKKAMRLGSVPAELAPPGMPEAALKEVDGKKVVDLDEARKVLGAEEDEFWETVKFMRRTYLKREVMAEGPDIYNTKNINRILGTQDNLVLEADEIERLANRAFDDVAKLHDVEQRVLERYPGKFQPMDPTAATARAQKAVDIVRIQRDVRPSGFDAAEMGRQMLWPVMAGGLLGQFTGGAGQLYGAYLGVRRMRKMMEDPGKFFHVTSTLENSVRKMGLRVRQVADNVLTPTVKGAKVAAQTRVPTDVKEEFDKNQELVLANRNPYTLLQNVSKTTAGISEDYPQVASAMTVRATQAQQFLSDRLPSGQRLPSGKELPPSRSQMKRFNNYVAAVNDPLTALMPELGYLNPEAMEVLHEVYPEVLEQLQYAVLHDVAEMQATGKSVPYGKRPIVSQLLGIDIGGALEIAANHDGRVMAEQAGGMPAPAPTAPRAGALREVPVSAMTQTERAAERVH